ncbi:MAG: CDC27 family protein [Acidobacteria bacterium]|nr:CDC27 family protein [Acidobacteriota bacterium]
MSACSDESLIVELTKDFTEPDPEGCRSHLLCCFAEQALPPTTMQKIERHVATCRDCAERVAGWRALQTLSRERTCITEAICPSAEDLEAYLYHETALPAIQRQRLAQHLEQCELCRQEVAWLRQCDARTGFQGSVPSDRVAPATHVRRRIRWMAVAAMVLLALAALLLYRAQAPAPLHGNPYAGLVAFPDIQYEEFAAYRPPEPALAKAYDMGLHLCKEGRYAEARPVLEPIAAKLADHPGVEFLLGYIYCKTGQMAKAYEYCLRAEATPPKSNQRCLFLFHLCLALGKPERALVEVREHAEDPNWQLLGRRVQEIQPEQPPPRRA